jgi:hypothetical protein
VVTPLREGVTGERAFGKQGQKPRTLRAERLPNG